MTDNARLSIYLAAPLFNPTERKFNELLAESLSDFGDIFLPQRDGMLLTEIVRRGALVATAQKQVFEADKKAIHECDVVVAVLDGRTIDEGVAFEIGFATAAGKTCLALKTDDRSMLPTGDNPMIVCACASVASSVNELTSTMRDFGSKRSFDSSSDRSSLRDETT